MLVKKKLGDYRIITGATKSEDRDKYIQEFNHDPDNKIFAFLLSTKAGGLGINLTAADTVIIYDSDWNPKADEQAQDRVHRMGQERPVVVYRLITEGTSIERRMHRIAAGKNALSRGILQDEKFLVDSNQEEKEEAKEEEEEEDTSIIDSGTGISKYGNFNGEVLDFWLRNELGNHTTLMQGISDDELRMILDRNRALQAGKWVADEVEAELYGMSATTSTTMAPSNTIPDNSCKRTRTSPEDTTSTTTITTRSESTSLSNKPKITPSKGLGYEFVYNQASTGLLPSTGMMTNTNNMHNKNSSNPCTHTSGNIEELSETPLQAHEKSSSPTHKKSKTKK